MGLLTKVIVRVRAGCNQSVELEDHNTTAKIKILSFASNYKRKLSGPEE